MADGLGLSVGTANLTAVHVGRSATRRAAVLTRYPQRPSEVGVPSENPNLAEPGLIITDFVDRVGDPVAMLAQDGSSHRAEAVLADALRALLVTVTGGRPSQEPVGVAYPAYWRPAAIDALRNALAAFAEFRDPGPAVVVSDATAALTALQQNPGVPARGVIAVCDFGATGTTVTLADAGQGFRPVAPPLRDTDLSGELIDQALLTRVIADLSEAGSVDLTGTSAIGSLSRLRAQCRHAKERLSAAAVTSLSVDLPGAAREVRLTRNELDDAMREPLHGFLAELHDMLQRSGIRQSDLVAVAAVGGGARMASIATALSEHLRAPIVTAPQPELASAIGAGLKAVRGAVPDEATAMAPAAATGLAPAAAAPEAPMSSTFAALAWSDADDDPDDPQSYGPEDEYADPYETTDDGARPRLDFSEREVAEHDDAVAVPWYRRPTMLIGIGAAVVLLVVGSAIAFVLRGSETDEPSGTTMTVTPATTTPSAPPPAAPAPAEQTQTVTQTQEPPVTVIEQPPANQPAPPPAETPPPPAETPPPSTEAPPTTTEAPPPPPTTTEPPPSTSNQPPFSPPYSTVPGLPWVPAPPTIPIPQP